MKQIKLVSYYFLFLNCFLFGCKKDNSLLPPAGIQSVCTISDESTTLSGNNASWEYEFDKDGNPSTIKANYQTGSTEYLYEIYPYKEIVSTVSQGKRHQRIIDYDADIFTGLPSKADISIDDGDTLKVHYYTYFFFYDTKNRLTKVGEQTNYVIGDWEYDLNIYYNDEDNVTGLRYEWTTGPNTPIAPITVKAYDDHPSPYAAIKCWKYLMINFNWDNYDPEPLLTALSNNNPLDYDFNQPPASNYTRAMSYTYNDNGFPTERTNTNKNANGEYTFLQTFAYSCK